MRSKDERRMLHSAKLRDVRPGQLSRKPNSVIPLVQRFKRPYATQRVNGQNFYTVLKTERQVREEEGT
jgi:hypothetical protein